ncbi:hypothetical protein I4U23_025649 [Adineta vaga]|nr:hypothetical protein I4U23_025649 [Adineta vaga]
MQSENKHKNRSLIAFEHVSRFIPVHIDMCKKKNMEEHLTIYYDVEGLVLRRGRTFSFIITFNQEFNTDRYHLSFIFKCHTWMNCSEIKIPLNGTSNDWLARRIITENETKNRIHIQISSPCHALIGKYSLLLETCSTEKDHLDKRTLSMFQFEIDIYFLFDPWQKNDTCSLNSLEQIDEYVMNEHGQIYLGLSEIPRSIPWYFGQFEGVVLLTALEVLRKIQISAQYSIDTLIVLRMLASKICSERGTNNGIFPAACEDRPFLCPDNEYTSSPIILKLFHESDSQSIRRDSGNNWQHVAVFCSLCRSLGIPCRIVTIYNATCPFEENMNQQQQSLMMTTQKTKNRPWYLWNECWLHRTDLPQDFSGWQVINSSFIQCGNPLRRIGPCSVMALKYGSLDFKWDTKEIHSMLNGNRELIRTENNAIRIKIITKALQNDQQYEDLTNNYMSNEISKKTTRTDDVDIDIRTPHSIKNGDDLPFLLITNNRSNSYRTLKVTLTIVEVNCIDHSHVLNSQKFHQSLTYTFPLNHYEQKGIRMKLEETQDIRKRCFDSIFKLSIHGIVKETNQIYQVEKYILNEEAVSMKLFLRHNVTEIDETIKLNVQINNLSSKPLNNGRITINGLGIIKTFRSKIPIVSKQVANIPFEIPTLRFGVGHLYVTFSTDSLRLPPESILLEAIPTKFERLGTTKTVPKKTQNVPRSQDKAEFNQSSNRTGKDTRTEFTPNSISEIKQPSISIKSISIEKQEAKDSPSTAFITSAQSDASINKQAKGDMAIKLDKVPSINQPTSSTIISTNKDDTPIIHKSQPYQIQSIADIKDKSHNNEVDTVTLTKIPSNQTQKPTTSKAVVTQSPMQANDQESATSLIHEHSEKPTQNIPVTTAAQDSSEPQLKTSITSSIPINGTNTNEKPQGNIRMYNMSSTQNAVPSPTTPAAKDLIKSTTNPLNQQQLHGNLSLDDQIGTANQVVPPSKVNLNIKLNTSSDNQASTKLIPTVQKVPINDKIQTTSTTNNLNNTKNDITSKKNGLLSQSHPSTTSPADIKTTHDIVPPTTAIAQNSQQTISPSQTDLGTKVESNIPTAPFIKQPYTIPMTETKDKTMEKYADKNTNVPFGETSSIETPFDTIFHDETKLNTIKTTETQPSIETEFDSTKNQTNSMHSNVAVESTSFPDRVTDTTLKGEMPIDSVNTLGTTVTVAQPINIKDTREQPKYTDTKQRSEISLDQPLTTRPNKKDTAVPSHDFGARSSQDKQFNNNHSEPEHRNLNVKLDSEPSVDKTIETTMKDAKKDVHEKHASTPSIDHPLETIIRATKNDADVKLESSPLIAKQIESAIQEEKKQVETTLESTVSVEQRTGTTLQEEKKAVEETLKSNPLVEEPTQTAIEGEKKQVDTTTESTVSLEKLIETTLQEQKKDVDESLKSTPLVDKPTESAIQGETKQVETTLESTVSVDKPTETTVQEKKTDVEESLKSTPLVEESTQTAIEGEKKQVDTTTESTVSLEKLIETTLQEQKKDVDESLKSTPLVDKPTESAIEGETKQVETTLESTVSVDKPTETTVQEKKTDVEESLKSTPLVEESTQTAIEGEKKQVDTTTESTVSLEKLIETTLQEQKKDVDESLKSTPLVDKPTESAIEGETKQVETTLESTVSVDKPTETTVQEKKTDVEESLKSTPLVEESTQTAIEGEKKQVDTTTESTVSLEKLIETTLQEQKKDVDESLKSTPLVDKPTESAIEGETKQVETTLESTVSVDKPTETTVQEKKTDVEESLKSTPLVEESTQTAIEGEKKQVDTTTESTVSLEKLIETTLQEQKKDVDESLKSTPLVDKPTESAIEGETKQVETTLESTVSVDKPTETTVQEKKTDVEESLKSTPLVEESTQTAIEGEKKQVDTTTESTVSLEKLIETTLQEQKKDVDESLKSTPLVDKPTESAIEGETKQVETTLECTVPVEKLIETTLQEQKKDVDESLKSTPLVDEPTQYAIKGEKKQVDATPESAVPVDKPTEATLPEKKTDVEESLKSTSFVEESTQSAIEVEKKQVDTKFESAVSVEKPIGTSVQDEKKAVEETLKYTPLVEKPTESAIEGEKKQVDTTFESTVSVHKPTESTVPEKKKAVQETLKSTPLVEESAQSAIEEEKKQVDTTPESTVSVEKPIRSTVQEGKTDVEESLKSTPVVEKPTESAIELELKQVDTIVESTGSFDKQIETTVQEAKKDIDVELEPSSYEDTRSETIVREDKRKTHGAVDYTLLIEKPTESSVQVEKKEVDDELKSTQSCDKPLRINMQQEKNDEQVELDPSAYEDTRSETIVREDKWKTHDAVEYTSPMEAPIESSTQEEEKNVNTELECTTFVNKPNGSALHEEKNEIGVKFESTSLVDKTPETRLQEERKDVNGKLGSALSIDTSIRTSMQEEKKDFRVELGVSSSEDTGSEAVVQEDKSETDSAKESALLIEKIIETTVEEEKKDVEIKVESTPAVNKRLDMTVIDELGENIDGKLESVLPIVKAVGTNVVEGTNGLAGDVNLEEEEEMEADGKHGSMVETKNLFNSAWIESEMKLSNGKVKTTSFSSSSDSSSMEEETKEVDFDLESMPEVDKALDTDMKTELLTEVDNMLDSMVKESETKANDRKLKTMSIVEESLGSKPAKDELLNTERIDGEVQCLTTFEILKEVIVNEIVKKELLPEFNNVVQIDKPSEIILIESEKKYIQETLNTDVTEGEVSDTVVKDEDRSKIDMELESGLDEVEMGDSNVNVVMSKMNVMRSSSPVEKVQHDNSMDMKASDTTKVDEHEDVNVMKQLTPPKHDAAIKLDDVNPLDDELRSWIDDLLRKILLSNRSILHTDSLKATIEEDEQPTDTDLRNWIDSMLHKISQSIRLKVLNEKDKSPLIIGQKKETEDEIDESTVSVPVISHEFDTVKLTQYLSAEENIIHPTDAELRNWIESLLREISLSNQAQRQNVEHITHTTLTSEVITTNDLLQDNQLTTTRKIEQKKLAIQDRPDQHSFARETDETTVDKDSNLADDDIQRWINDLLRKLSLSTKTDLDNEEKLIPSRGNSIGEDDKTLENSVSDEDLKGWLKHLLDHIRSADEIKFNKQYETLDHSTCLLESNTDWELKKTKDSAHNHDSIFSEETVLANNDHTLPNSVIELVNEIDGDGSMTTTTAGTILNVPSKNLPDDVIEAVVERDIDTMVLSLATEHKSDIFISERFEHHCQNTVQDIIPPSVMDIIDELTGNVEANKDENTLVKHDVLALSSSPPSEQSVKINTTESINIESIPETVVLDCSFRNSMDFVEKMSTDHSSKNSDNYACSPLEQTSLAENEPSIDDDLRSWINDLLYQISLSKQPDENDENDLRDWLTHLLHQISQSNQTELHEDKQRLLEDDELPADVDLKNWIDDLLWQIVLPKQPGAHDEKSTLVENEVDPTDDDLRSWLTQLLRQISQSNETESHAENNIGELSYLNVPEQIVLEDDELSIDDDLRNWINDLLYQISLSKQPDENDENDLRDWLVHLLHQISQSNQTELYEDNMDELSSLNASEQMIDKDLRDWINHLLRQIFFLNETELNDKGDGSLSVNSNNFSTQYSINAESDENMKEWLDNLFDRMIINDEKKDFPILVADNSDQTSLKSITIETFRTTITIVEHGVNFKENSDTEDSLEELIDGLTSSRSTSISSVEEKEINELMHIYNQVSDSLVDSIFESLHISRNTTADSLYKELEDNDNPEETVNLYAEIIAERIRLDVISDIDSIFSDPSMVTSMSDSDSISDSDGLTYHTADEALFETRDGRSGTQSTLADYMSFTDEIRTDDDYTDEDEDEDEDELLESLPDGIALYANLLSYKLVKSAIYLYKSQLNELLAMNETSQAELTPTLDDKVRSRNVFIPIKSNPEDSSKNSTNHKLVREDTLTETNSDESFDEQKKTNSFKSANDNQQSTEHEDSMTMILSECLIQQNDKPLSNRLQMSLTSSLTETYRPTTTSAVLEESIRRTVSSGIRSTVISPSPIPLRTRSCFQLHSLIFKNEQQIVQQSTIVNTSSTNQINISPRTNVSFETTVTDQDEAKKYQSTTNISQRHSKTRRFKSGKKCKDIEHDMERTKDIDQSSSMISTGNYDYKSPFTKEYDLAILSQAQFATNNSYTNEWNLKDFYRDVKTPFELHTNTKDVFEKCLKLARLQAITIKWEQRRRPNETTYNRSIKSAASDRTTTLSLSSTISSKTTYNEKDIQEIGEIKHDLRCNECKRFLCAGNCIGPSAAASAAANMRDSLQRKLHSRSARTVATHLRPRTTQHTSREIKSKSVNSVVLTPSFTNESQMKRSPTQFNNGFLPGKLIRTHRQETLALITTQKISS